MRKLIGILSIASILISCGNHNENQNEDKYEGVIIVAHKTDNTIQLIERKSGERVITLDTGIEPHEVEVSDDGALAVVCNYGNREIAGNTLSVYNIKQAKLVRTIDLGEHTRPHGMQWIAGTNRLVVTAESTNSILVINVDEGTIEKAIGTEQPVSHMLALSTDFTKAFVSSIRTGNVTVIDLQNDSILSQVYSGKGAEGVAISPNGEELWVTNRSDNTLTVFNTQSLELIKTLVCGDFPIRIKFTPDGSKVLVSNAQSADVAVFDAISKTLLAKIKLTVPLAEEGDDNRFFAKDFKGSSIPIGLTVPHNSTVYVANTNADLVSEIDLVKMEITRHFTTGKQPDGVNFSPFTPNI